MLIGPALVNHLAALLTHSYLPAITQVAGADSDRAVTLVAHQHKVRDVNRALALEDATLFRGRPGLRMTLDEVELFDEGSVELGDHLQNLTALSLVLPGDHHHQIILLDRAPVFHRHDYPQRVGNPRRENAAAPRSTIWELRPILLVLDHLWRQGNNLHELGVTELSCYRAKDPCANRVILLVQEHSGVSIEFDVGSIRAPKFLCGSDHHRPHHVTFLHRAFRDRFLDVRDDDVAQASVPLRRSPQHLDQRDPLGTGIVGHLHDGP